MRLLQSPALPLGYPAIRNAATIVAFAFGASASFRMADLPENPEPYLLNFSAEGYALHTRANGMVTPGTINWPCLGLVDRERVNV